MQAPNNGHATNFILLTLYMYIYIKHEYPETIKIDVHVYIYGVICEIIWGFLSQNEAIMHPKIAPKV